MLLPESQDHPESGAGDIIEFRRVNNNGSRLLTANGFVYLILSVAGISRIDTSLQCDRYDVVVPFDLHFAAVSYSIVRMSENPVTSNISRISSDTFLTVMLPFVFIVF